MASGMTCYHHQSRRAAAQCAGCGKAICKNCHDDYGVSIGQYAGKALCYDCTTQLVESNVKEVGKFKANVKREFITITTGAAIGAVLGLSGGIFGFIIGMGAGGSAWVAFKAFLRICSSAVSGDFTGAMGALFTILLCPIRTAKKLISRFAQMRQADGILASDSQALREMRDYFAYTQAMEKNAGVDLAKLAGQGSELYNNTYARAVLDKGEKAAQAKLRKSVVQIAANGEIIRSFDEESKDEAA